MGAVVEKTPCGAFALVMVIGMFPVFLIVKSAVADVPTGTSPKSSEAGICRCAVPETAVAATGTVTEPRSLATDQCVGYRIRRRGAERHGHRNRREGLDRLPHDRHRGRVDVESPRWPAR